MRFYPRWMISNEQINSLIVIDIDYEDFNAQTG